MTANGSTPGATSRAPWCCACFRSGWARPQRLCSIKSREDDMQVPKDAVLLRIFIGEGDRHASKPLYEAIVLKERELHLAGATVLRGPMGYGHSSRLHTAKILRRSEDLPPVIALLDS